MMQVDISSLTEEEQAFVRMMRQRRENRKRAQQERRRLRLAGVPAETANAA